MKAIPLSIIAASTMAVSQIAYAGVKIDTEQDVQVNDELVKDIAQSLEKTDNQVKIDSTITEAFSVDGKIDGFSVADFLAQSNMQVDPGVKSASCCHGNCHSNCHGNCHGSRSWR